MSPRRAADHPSTDPPSTDPVFDLAVVGAGPAGRALAHRALAAGLDVAVIDPAPDRPWTATFGAFTDDLPHWLGEDVVACRAPSITVHTPMRRIVERGYSVLDAERLRRRLSIDGGTILAALAEAVTATRVVTSDGRSVTARCVVDTRDRRGAPDRRPRQRAAGIVVDADLPVAGRADARGEMVLMDWRPSPAEAPGTDPTFSYRVEVAAGDTGPRRLVEETCLAGAPPVGAAELRRRGDARMGGTVVPHAIEEVDFPLLADRRPWTGRPNDPIRFGAAGGLMNPATGYSVASSLSAVDDVVDALRTGAPVHETLWGRGARGTFRLRLLGLDVLLALRPDDLRVFFDRFFALDVSVQRAYLSGRDDVAGVLRAMWAVWLRVPIRVKAAVAAASVSAAVRGGRSGAVSDH